MKLNKTFIIQHKETKEQWYSVNGKCTWKNTGAPKIAFNRKASFEDKPRYENQEEYEVVELKHESEDKLKDAVELLGDFHCYSMKDIGYSESPFKDRVEYFLKSVNYFG